MKPDRSIRLAGFEIDGIADGPGLRCVVFVQGCPHHCPGCQNPQTWEFGVGEETTVAEVEARIRATAIDTGVTFSGGEPFAQASALADLAERLRPDFDLAAYTGYTWEGLMALAKREPDVIRLLRQLDVVVDGPFVEALRDRNLLFRGTSNQRILDPKASLEAGRAIWTSDPGWVGDDGSARADG